MSNPGCVSAAALALLAMASSCSRGHPREIIADAPLQVLENASPLDYPSTNPRPNKVLDTVPVGGRLLVIGREYEKDYMYYRVELPDGRTGFVIGRVGAFHEQP